VAARQYLSRAGLALGHSAVLRTGVAEGPVLSAPGIAEGSLSKEPALSSSTARLSASTEFGEGSPKSELAEVLSKGREIRAG